MKNVKLPICLLFFILVLLATCCNGQHKRSFLNQNSCDIPCWNENLPGVTTTQELIDNIYDLSFIEKDSIITNGGPWDIFDDRVFFTYSDIVVHGVAHFNDNVLSDISFDGELGTSVGDVVDSFGEPDFVINVPVTGGIPGYPDTSYVLTFIYKELGISFAYGTSDLPKRWKENLEPEIPIKFINFFDPKIFDQMVESGLFGQSVLTGEQTLKYLRPWSGYGSIQDKYPPAKR
jgi:hypothetical protein